MDAYTEFAKVYDLFMDNIPYEEWGAYLKGLLHENGVDDGLVSGAGLWNRYDDRNTGRKPDMI